MIKKQKQSFFDNYIRENKVRLAVNLGMLIFGVVCGSMLFLYSANASEFSSQAKSYIENVKNLYSKQIFISCLKDAAIMCTAFLVCSLFYIGEFLCPGYVFLRSAASGFSACAVMGAFGLKKGTMILASLAAANVFYFTGLISLSVETAKQSRFVSGDFNKRAKNMSFISYLITIIFPVLLVFSACVVESFLAPYLILWCLKIF